MNTEYRATYSLVLKYKVCMYFKTQILLYIFDQQL